MSKDHNFIKGDYVFAKVRGYPAWPARIEEILDPRPATLKYNVFFFGTSETAAVQAKEVYPYLSNKEKYGKPIKRKFFKEAIQELEEELTRVNSGESLPFNESVSKSNLPNYEAQHPVEPQIQAHQEDESVVTKKKRKFSEAMKAIENEGEVSAKRKRKSSAVSAKDKNEETAAKGKRKSVSVDLQETVEDDNVEDGKDSIADKRKLNSNKILKNKSDASSSNIDNQELEGRKRKRSSIDADTIALKEQISRSGRRIKPKKFLYDDEENKEDVEGKERSGKGKLFETEMKDGEDENAENNKKTEQVTPQKKRKSKDMTSPNEKKVESPSLSSLGRVIWVKASTGDVVQIKIDHDRPEKIKSIKGRAQYDAEYAESLEELREKVEHGKMMTDEVMVQLKPSPGSLALMTEEEIEQRKNRRSVERKLGRTRWLKLESRIVNIDVLLRSALQKEKANIEKALELLDEYISLPIDPLMLKKNPQLVETVKKLIYYTGNTHCWNYSQEAASDFNKKALKIRHKAMTLSSKFRSLFAVTKHSDFWRVFDESLNVFKDATKHLSPDLLYELTVDPLSPYYNEVAECDREDREHDLKMKERLAAIEIGQSSNN